MVSAKDMIIKVIPASIANDFIKKCHYSGKVCNNSSIHFGVFLNGQLHGAISLGPSLDKRKTIGTVKNTTWNEFIEINRLAFDEALPKNSESRAISIVIKLLKKNAPQIKWLLSYADATQCGDGAIYRASGFYLIGIRKNKTIIKMQDGFIIASNVLRLNGSISRKYNPNKETEKELIRKYGMQYLPGFQIKYIYFIDKDKIKDLTVPILPFKMIDDLGAGMYRGKLKDKGVGSVAVCTSSIQEESGGSILTPTHEV